MSDTHAAPETTTRRDHGPEDHTAATGEAEGAHAHDEHMHTGMGLGPMDLRMWAVGLIGVALALIITAGIAVATSFEFNA